MGCEDCQVLSMFAGAAHLRIRRRELNFNQHWRAVRASGRRRSHRLDSHLASQ